MPDYPFELILIDPRYQIVKPTRACFALSHAADWRRYVEQGLEIGICFAIDLEHVVMDLLPGIEPTLAELIQKGRESAAEIRLIAGCPPVRRALAAFIKAHNLPVFESVNAAILASKVH